MMNAQDIGAILRAAREAKGISIANAAVQTNLSIGILEKLEANQFAEMTAPVFARGYLMQYSRFLGLDADVMAADFNQLGFKDAEIRLNSANIASQSHSFKRYHFGTWLTIVPLIALAGLILTQVFNPNSWLINQFKQAFAKERAPLIENAENSGGNQITLQIGPDNSTLITPPENPPQEMPNLTSLTPPSPPVDNSTETSLTLTAIDAENSDTSNEAKPLKSGEGDNTATNEVPPQTETATPPPAAANQLALSISNESWIEIRNKEHRIVVSKVYQSGDTVEIPLTDAPYELNIGRPEAVSLSINGQAADLMQYRVGKSRRFKVTINE